MLKLIFAHPKDTPLRLLCLGAHSDDIEIGCGGTILRLAREYPQLEVHWVVMGALGERAEEARKSAEELLAGVERKSITIKNYRDGFFPYRGEEIKNSFEELKARLSPDLILTHYRQDLHQDHRLMCELTWNTWRDHLILEYEIPKYDGDLGSPNFFVQLDKETCRAEDRLHPGAFQDPGEQALVHRGDVHRAAAPARDRIQVAGRVCRGVLLPQGSVLRRRN